MRRLFLPIEIKVREFHSKLFLALLATERGFETYLGGQNELIEKVPKFGRGFYIDKSTAKTKREWFSRCRALGNYVLAWDEEGLVYLNDEVYHLTRMDPVSFGMTDLFFCWGKNQQKTVLSKYPDSKQKVVVVGNPRIDLLRPEIRSFCNKRVHELKKKYGRMILINTNFALHNYAKGPEAAAKMFDPYPLANKKKLITDWFAFQRRGYESFRKAAEVIYERFPEHTLVIRPCPSESSDPWHQQFAGKQRCVISKEGNVVEWIRAADAMIQFNCTTGVEAYLLDQPSIAYRSILSDEFETPLPIACSVAVFNESELLEKLGEIVNARENESIHEISNAKNVAVIKQHLALDENVTVCEKILDEICSRDFPERPYTLPPVPLIKQIWRAWLRVYRQPDPVEMRYYREKFPGLTTQEVIDVAASFSNITGRFSNVRITEAGRNIVHLKAN